MKKCFFLLLGVLWGSLSFLFAENVPVDRALQVATNFIQQIGETNLRANQSLELVYTARPTLRSGAPNAYYYVFNRGNNGGYVIISADDRAYPVLGYGTSGDFSYEKIPDNMKWWLQGYADQIQYAYTNGLMPGAKIQEEWDSLIQGRGLPQLRAQTMLTTALWNQGTPYNNECPLIGGERALTGCVATSMGIVMKYHTWPVQGTGSARTELGNYFADFNVNYSWDDMLNEYLADSYSPAQGNAVATLLYHCGVSCNMEYGVSASGAQSGRIITALTTYFGYDKGIAYIQKDDYADSEWRNMLSQELETYSRPVIYSGSGTGEGHTFVIDGVESTRYHLNWGWGGDLNGWFTLTALNPDDDNYSSDQAMIINVKPDEGGSYLNELRITNTSSSTGGLKVSGTPVQGTSFTLTLSALRGISPDFVASIAIAHFDKNKRMKGLVCSPREGYNFKPYTYYQNMSFSCTITEAIEEGDQLYLVSKVSDGEYKIVEGGPNVASVINLTNSTPSDVYQVTWNTPSGVTVSPVSGYDANSIAAGGTFKFKITVPIGKAVVVKNGPITLTPDASGVYTISNIQNNIRLTLSLTSLTYQVTWNTPSGVTVSPVSGYDANSIAAGGTFKFTITAPTGKAVIVTNGTTTLTPDASGVYTLLNIQKDIRLTLEFERTYKITWSILPGVTVDPEPGYDATSVLHGENFKFKLKCTGSKFGVAQVGNELLPPDAAGVYTLENVQEDIFIELHYGGTITYRVTLPVVTGFDIQASTGYDVLSVRYDSDFKFTVTPKAGYEAYTIKVTANNVVLTPASGNVYTIRNVKADQTVKLEATPPYIPPPPPTTYQIFSRADPGATLVAESGYTTDVVYAWDNFKFHVSIDPAYQNWELNVMVDGLPLWPDSEGVYTILYVRENKEVVITLTEVYTVTFVKPDEETKMVAEAGYDAERIVAGDSFKFHLVSRYTDDVLTVKANERVLHPVGKVYTIDDIREDQQVVVSVIDVGNEKISSDNVRIQVRENKICIMHPTMNNVPVYITSFNGVLCNYGKLNGGYTELDVPGKGAYIVSFKGFSRKIIVK